MPVSLPDVELHVKGGREREREREREWREEMRETEGFSSHQHLSPTH